MVLPRSWWIMIQPLSGSSNGIVTAADSPLARNSVALRTRSGHYQHSVGSSARSACITLSLSLLSICATQCVPLIDSC